MSATHERVVAHLEHLDAAYKVMPCDPDYADTAAFCERYGVDPGVSANAIVVASRRPPGRYAVCVALATTKLDVNRKVRDLLEVRKLSFATPEQTIEVTGMMIGGVTPFGLPPELLVFVDSQVLDPQEIVVGGGDRSSKIRLDPAVFRAAPHISVIEGLASSITSPQDGGRSDE